MSPAPPATNSSWRPAHANRLWGGGDTASARKNEVRRSSGHDRLTCSLGTSTVDAFQLLQRLLSRLLVSYRPLANIEDGGGKSRRDHTLGEKIKIEQVASSARQTLAAAKATSLQRCVRTQLRAGSHCLNPRARSPRRLLPLIPRRPSDARPARIVCPRRRPLAPRLTLARRRRARPRRRQRTRPPRHRNDPGREWCSTVATGAPNCHARRDVHNSTLNTARDHFPERLRSLDGVVALRPEGRRRLLDDCLL